MQIERSPTSRHRRDSVFGKLFEPRIILGAKSHPLAKAREYYGELLRTL